METHWWICGCHTTFNLTDWEGIMKINHIGVIAGVPSALSDIDKQRGHESRVIQTYPHPFKFNRDEFFLIDGFNVHSAVNSCRYLCECTKADRIHIHEKAPLKGIEILIFKLLGKEVIFHYHGTDIRGKKQPFLHKFADKKYVSTPDLLKSVDAVWVPNLLNDKEIPPKNRHRTGKKIKLLHIPSKPAVKGSEFIDSAVKRLQEEGYEIEYLRVQNISHEEALKLMSQCDVYIDQLLLGMYGVSSLECAFMGVPVVCYVNPELYEIKTPFINADKNSIYDTLKTVCNMTNEELYTIGENEKTFYEEVKRRFDAIY